MYRKKITQQGNPFVGLFARTNSKFTLVGSSVSEKFKRACGDVLGTEIVELTIAGSDLIGIFSAMNSNGIILPFLALKDEIEKIKEIGINYYITKEKYTAIGNNIVVNDKGGLANPDISKAEIEKISECLGVEIVQKNIAEYKTVGSVCVCTNKGFLAHNNVTEEELAYLEKVFKVKGGIGTVNMGVSFVGLCIIANEKGYVVGELTSGFELQRIDEALG